MEKRSGVDRKSRPKKSKAGHVVIIREHLAERLISQARSLHENPGTWGQVPEFLEDICELLRRFKNIAQEESEEVGSEMPYCFRVRILRITEVVKRVLANMITRALGEWQERTGNEVACILANIGAHIDRLTIDRNEDRPYYRLRDIEKQYVELFDRPAVSSSDGYVPLLRMNGGVETWNRMNSLVADCDCLLCSTQIADMIVYSVEDDDSD